MVGAVLTYISIVLWRQGLPHQANGLTPASGGLEYGLFSLMMVLLG